MHGPARSLNISHGVVAYICPLVPDVRLTCVHVRPCDRLCLQACASTTWSRRRTPTGTCTWRTGPSACSTTTATTGCWSHSRSSPSSRWTADGPSPREHAKRDRQPSPEAESYGKFPWKGWPRAAQVFVYVLLCFYIGVAALMGIGAYYLPYYPDEQRLGWVSGSCQLQTGI